ncbi:MAG: hypothetical protein HOV71_12560 [Hamadaea sp.]|nr:hypothetical protein [Hamadaea sp.]NUR48959.1 hypothetical protein [Hamadaea sp.]NUT02454.1 hypothetical protein [Hamadaea sp.]
MTPKAPLLGLLAASLFALAGCGSDTPTASGTPSSSAAAGVAASPTTGGGAATGADCLKGTWNVDVTKLAQAAAALIGNGSTGSGTGAITLTFADQMTIKFTQAAINIKTTQMGQEVTMKQTFDGSSTSTSWSGENGKLSGTTPGGTVTTKSVMVMNGVETPLTTKAFDGNLDLSKNSLAYTCSGDTATLDSGYVKWELHRAS